MQDEFTLERRVKIPDDLRELYYQVGRPTPIVRARRFEKIFNAPIEIYMKMESYTYSGSHKIDSALVQAYYSDQEGVSFFTTETGAGQWGIAVALASTLNNLKAKIFMVSSSFPQKSYRVTMMKMLGSEVYDSPSNLTLTGKELIQCEKIRENGRLSLVKN